MKYLWMVVLGLSVVSAQGVDRVVESSCATAFSAGLRVMIDNDFQPTTTDKAAGLATFTFDKVLDGTDVSRYAIVPKWIQGQEKYIIYGNPLKIGSASLLLADAETKCKVTIKVTGYRVLAGGSTWVQLESNGEFEARLHDKIKEVVSNGR